MIRSIASTLIAIACLGTAGADEKGAKMASPLDYKMKGLDGKEIDLAQYKGKVVLVVNVASKCGYTPQYKGLQELYTKYEKQGFVVLGVPANEFGKQEPGSDTDIAAFCETKYRVTFPMLSKVVVKGDGITPMYQFLTAKETNPQFAGPIGWNFEKFLIGKDGQVAGRFKSGVAPESPELAKAIEAEIKK